LEAFTANCYCTRKSSASQSDLLITKILLVTLTLRFRQHGQEIQLTQLSRNVGNVLKRDGEKSLFAQEKGLKFETGFAIASSNSIACMIHSKRQLEIFSSTIGASSLQLFGSSDNSI